MLNKQIAGELGIAEQTVKIHRGNMTQKMEARSVAELIHKVGKLDLAGALGLGPRFYSGFRPGGAGWHARASDEDGP